LPKDFLVVLMIDGIHFGGQVLVVALGGVWVLQSWEPLDCKWTWLGSGVAGGVKTAAPSAICATQHEPH
jgi:hypothetical protein